MPDGGREAPGLAGSGPETSGPAAALGARAGPGPHEFYRSSAGGTGPGVRSGPGFAPRLTPLARERRVRFAAETSVSTSGRRPGRESMSGLAGAATGRVRAPAGVAARAGAGRDPRGRGEGGRRGRGASGAAEWRQLGKNCRRTRMR